MCKVATSTAIDLVLLERYIYWLERLLAVPLKAKFCH